MVRNSVLWFIINGEIFWSAGLGQCDVEPSTNGSDARFFGERASFRTTTIQDYKAIWISCFLCSSVANSFSDFSTSKVFSCVSRADNLFGTNLDRR